MKEEELIREANEIRRDLKREEERRSGFRFFKVIISIFMVTIIAMMIIPFTGILHNPSPGTIPVLEPETNINFTDTRITDLNSLAGLEVSGTLRRSAITITSGACKNSEICYAKSLFYYVRDRINYLSDPSYEYIQSPEETLLGAGDCEDQAILLLMLMKSIGIDSRLAVIPGHAYTQIYLRDAPKRYIGDDGWISLDPTCTSCEFGENPSLGIPKRTIVI